MAMPAGVAVMRGGRHLTQSCLPGFQRMRSHEAALAECLRRFRGGDDGQGLLELSLRHLIEMVPMEVRAG